MQERFSFNTKASKTFKAYLNDYFRIKDGGPLKYDLDIEVAHGP